MSITRVGTNQKYSSGWDVAFGKAKAAATKPAKKASPKKKAGAKKKAKK